VEIVSDRAKFFVELYKADRGRYWEIARATPISEIPELVAAWDDDESLVRWPGLGNPANVMLEGETHGSRFKCERGHSPRMRGGKFLIEGCEICRRSPPTKSMPVAETQIASQWHPTRNGKHTPESVVITSRIPIWWRAECCGHEWQATPKKRLRGATWPAASRARLCPNCETVLNSLAVVSPDIAAEWSPNNPVTPWHVTPAGTTTFLPEWICPNDPTHVWNATLAQRHAGMRCPDCYEWGKSQVELDHHAAAVRIFGAADSGATVEHAEFESRNAWTVDILFTYRDSKVVLEYDGVYWHSAEDKQAVDRRKSKELIDAGYVVVRLREEGLPTLAISDPHYKEFTVSPSRPRPAETVQEVLDWLNKTDTANY
jgi:hypothetical protein